MSYLLPILFVVNDGHLMGSNVQTNRMLLFLEWLRDLVAKRPKLLFLELASLEFLDIMSS